MLASIRFIAYKEAHIFCTMHLMTHVGVLKRQIKLKSNKILKILSWKKVRELNNANAIIRPFAFHTFNMFDSWYKKQKIQKKIVEVLSRIL